MRNKSDLMMFFYGELVDQEGFLSRGARHSIDDKASPPMDVVVTDAYIHIFVDLPGVGKDDVVAYIQGDLLIVEGHKRVSYPQESGRAFYRVERQYGWFRRILHLRSQVDPDAMQMELTNGILHIKWEK